LCVCFVGAISWRQQDIKYRKNEIYIDVVERVNVLISPKGTVLESGMDYYFLFYLLLLLFSFYIHTYIYTHAQKSTIDVSGTVQIKCYLSGMPECRFGINDKILLDKEVSNEEVTSVNSFNNDK
jgi:AP-2 complex subunit mu-1